MNRFYHAKHTSEKRKQMNKKETENKEKAAPVMKRLARPMSEKEQLRVAGAGPGSMPSNDGFGGAQYLGDIDFQN
jgi:hypothetical protein